jgi:Cofilin/tropomyosin-type actin-binding protein
MVHHSPFTILSCPAWAEVRDNCNTDVDWIIAGYENGSKTDIGILQKGSGGVAACARSLPGADPCFGGFRLSSGRFRCFYYAPDGASVMKKGRASMHKNGVMNVLEGCDGEVTVKPDMKEEDI